MSEVKLKQESISLKSSIQINHLEVVLESFGKKQTLVGLLLLNYRKS